MAVIDHSLCCKIAVEHGVSVVNVEYRLAPEFGFPIPTNDAYASLRWVSCLTPVAIID